MTTLFEHPSEEQQHTLRRFRESLPQIKQQLFDVFLHDSGQRNNPEEIIQQFLDATIFKNGKGMLFTLNEQGNINRQSVEEHQISLKDFSTSFRFFQEYLSKNDLGKQIIPIMIQKFIQAIDQQLVQHAGEIPEEITQEWTKSKDDIERKRKITLTEFGGYVEKLFSGRLHKKAPLDNLEIAPILGKIYKQVSFPLKEITQELEQQNIISAEQGERLFEKGNKWSTLATNLDCIVTGDNQKQLEKIQEKKKRTSQFQNFFTATIPDLQDLMKSLPIPPKTPEDRNKLIRKNIVQRNNAFLQSIPKDDIELQVAMRDYMEKVKDTMYTLLDLTQKEINIETPNGTLTFPVEKSIGEGKGMLDMKFDLTIPDEAEEFLSADTSPLKGQFFTVEDQSGKKQKLTEEYVVELTDSQGNKKTGKLVETVDSQKPLPPALQQKIDKEGENNLRFLVDEQGNPIEAYTDEELKQSTLTVKDRKMKLEGEDLQSFVGQVLSMQVGGFDSQSEKAEKFFAKIPSPNKEILLEEKEQQRRDFLTYFQEEVKGHPFEYDKYQANQDNEDNQKLSLAALEKKEAEAGLKKGTRLWIDTGRDSELPPKGKDGTQRVQMEILDASGDTIKMKMFGGELGLGNLEGKVLEFPKNADYRKMFIGKFANGAGGQLYKLPPVSSGRTLQQCMETIKKAHIFGDYYENPLFLDQSIVFRDNEILFNLGDEKEQKVQYFGLQEELSDKLSQNVHYKIEYLKNGKIKVSSEYLSQTKDKHKKDTWETKGYSREMDYNNFLIFIATKKLKPKTNTQQEEEKKNNEQKIKENKIPLTKQGWKRWSLNNIIHTVQNCRKKIDGLVDEYSKEKDEDFMNMVVGDRGLYRHLGKLFGAIGRTGGAEAVSRAEMEHWNERDNRVWKKIKKWLDEFDKDQDFGTTVNKKGYLPHFLKGKNIIEYISEQKGLITNEKERYFAAAVYLANIKKGGGPYARMGHLQFTGHWVKLLLGPEHHARFVRQYKLQKSQLDSEKGEHKVKDGHIMNSEGQAEMLYIVNQLDERGGDNDKFFGFQQGIEPTNKTRLSAQFAGELEARYKDYISNEKMNEGVNKQRDVTDFQNTYNEFKRFGLSDRPAKALPFIQRMAEMAKTPAQYSKLQVVLLFGLTSGYFRFIPQARKVRLEKLCRSMAFTPGMMVVEPRHPEKIAHLLDVLTDGKFSKPQNEGGTGWKWANFDNNPDKPKDEKNYGKYFYTFENFRNTNKMGTTISEGIQTIHLRDAKDDEVITYIQNREFEDQPDAVNEDVLGNGRLAKWNALGKAKGTFNTLTNYSDGRFNAKDSDMEQAMEDFWGGVNEGITRYGSDLSKPQGLAYLIKKVLFNWFSNYGFDAQGKEKFARTLGTIVELRKKNVDDADFSINDRNIEQILQFMVYGKVFASGLGSNPPKEIKAAIKNLTNVLWNHIKAGNIDEKFIEVNFGGEYKQHFTKNRYKYLHQEQYNRIKNANSSDKEAYKLKSELGNLDDIFVNNEMRSVYDRINTGGGNSLNLNLGANAYDEEGIKHTNKFLDTYKGYRNNVPRGGTSSGGTGKDEDDDDENNS